MLIVDLHYIGLALEGHGLRYRCIVLGYVAFGYQRFGRRRNQACVLYAHGTYIEITSYRKHCNCGSWSL